MQGTQVQRLNMVNKQLRPAGVSSQAILDAMLNEPREKYLPSKFKNLAYTDTYLPTANNETIVTLSPIYTGLLLQALDIKKNHKVLEINTGSGYLTALLGKLAKTIITLEDDLKHFQTIKEQFFDKNKYPNIRAFHANGLQGFTPEAPFDIICLNIAVNQIPDILFKQLQDNGKIFSFIKNGTIINATLYKKNKNRKITKTILFETTLPYLKTSLSTEFNL